jgi:hypothetical protein
LQSYDNCAYVGLAIRNKIYTAHVPVFIAALSLRTIPATEIAPAAVVREERANPRHTDVADTQGKRGKAAEPGGDVSDMNWRSHPEIVRAIPLLDQQYATATFGDGFVIRDPQEDHNTDAASLKFAPSYFVPK